MDSTIEILIIELISYRVDHGISNALEERGTERTYWVVEVVSTLELLSYRVGHGTLSALEERGIERSYCSVEAIGGLNHRAINNRAIIIQS